MATGSLYFHSPCFDGIVSAVLSAELLERVHDWLPLEPRAVNYEVREQWLARTMKLSVLSSTCKVVAYFLADHLNLATMDCWINLGDTTGLAARCEGCQA